MQDVAGDLGIMVLRHAMGGLLVGHGAQKLFGWFGGHGFEGTKGWLESMGLQPGHVWATAAGASEFVGGLMTSLGLLYPLGPVMTIGAMGMATAKVHWGKPIWVTSGGAELPVTNMAIAAALILTGPGKYSLDGLLGIKLPRWIAVPALLAVAAAIAAGMQPGGPQPAVKEVAGAELQAGVEAAHPV